MVRKVKCEGCGELKEISENDFGKWINYGDQFFCDKCKEDLGIEEDD